MTIGKIWRPRGLAIGAGLAASALLLAACGGGGEPGSEATAGGDAAAGTLTVGTTDKITKIAAEAKTCDDFVKAARDAGGAGQTVTDLVLDQQRPAVRALIGPLKTNQATKATVDGTNVVSYMRCSDDLIGKAPEEKDVREALSRQKLGAYAERYLKELRRSAYVDIRV